jgi:hypothetical protein
VAGNTAIGLTVSPEEEIQMGIGSSIVVFAVGAVLRFAVTVSSTHFNVNTIGVILMIVGAVGFVVSLIFWSSWGGFNGGSRRSRDTTVIRGDGLGGSVATHDREII